MKPAPRRRKGRKQLLGLIRLERQAGRLDLQAWKAEQALEVRAVNDPDAVSILGRGAFGATYLVDSESAIKVVQLSPAKPQQLLELLSEYQRAHAIPAHPLLLTPRRHWLARIAAGQRRLRRLQYMQEMAPVLGGTLSRTIKEYQRQRDAGTRPSERSLRRLLAQLLGLAQLMHRAGIVHRDLKPSNLLLLSSTGPPVLHVCDFGAATRVGQLYSHSKPRDAIFTLDYAAPELLDPRCPPLPADPAQDMFSIGVIMYQLLAGPGTHPLVPAHVLRSLNSHQQGSHHTSRSGPRSGGSSPSGEQQPRSRWNRPGSSGRCCAVLHEAMRQHPTVPALPEGYDVESWSQLIHGLCALRPEERWGWADVLFSPLLPGSELRQWSSSARGGAALRRADGQLQDAAALDALAALYDDICVEQEAARQLSTALRPALTRHAANLERTPQPPKTCHNAPSARSTRASAAATATAEAPANPTTSSPALAQLQEQITQLSALLKPLTLNVHHHGTCNEG